MFYFHYNIFNTLHPTLQAPYLTSILLVQLVIGSWGFDIHMFMYLEQDLEILLWEVDAAKEKENTYRGHNKIKKEK